MPSRDTKVITMRVTNEEYFKWLELAAKNRQPISTYMKSCINTHLGILSSYNGMNLEPPPVAKKDTSLIEMTEIIIPKCPKKYPELWKIERFAVREIDGKNEIYRLGNFKWIKSKDPNIIKRSDGFWWFKTGQLKEWEKQDLHPLVFESQNDGTCLIKCDTKPIKIRFRKP